MLDAAERLIKEYDMLPSGARVLCAVSGGADSMCLLHLLSRREDISLVAAHFNHGLRGEESDGDEAFVREICTQWDIPLTVGRGDVASFSQREGLTTEEAARTLRYAFLETAAETEGCIRILTAHNADDNAETLLLNLVRGTGLRGLTGIPPCRGNIARPLLTTPREEILTYLEREGIPHREDSSNRDEAYTRNKLRSQVTPILRELNPRAVEHINAAAAQLATVDSYLDQEVQPYLAKSRTGENRVLFPMKVLQEAPEALRGRIVLRLLDSLPVGRKDLGAVHLEAILSLKEGGHLDLPHGLTASCKVGLLGLSIAAPPPPAMPLLFGRPLLWGSWTVTLMDHPEGHGLSIRPGGSFTVRSCPPNERLTLLGSNGPRTFKRLCQDRHYSPSTRDTWPAFFVDGRLAAVWPFGVDAAFVPEKESWFIQIK